MLVETSFCCFVACNRNHLWLTQVGKEFIAKDVASFRALKENSNNRTSSIWFWFLCYFRPKFKFQKERDYLVELKLPNKLLGWAFKIFFQRLNSVGVGWLFQGELRHWYLNSKRKHRCCANRNNVFATISKCYVADFREIGWLEEIQISTWFILMDSWV